MNWRTVTGGKAKFAQVCGYIVTVARADEYSGAGLAFCSRKDVYVRDTGVQIALKRADHYSTTIRVPLDLSVVEAVVLAVMVGHRYVPDAIVRHVRSEIAKMSLGKARGMVDALGASS